MYQERRVRIILISLLLLALTPTTGFSQQGELNILCVSTEIAEDLQSNNVIKIFFDKHDKLIDKFVSFAELRENPDLCYQYDILWFHTADSTVIANRNMFANLKNALEDYLDGGGHLLLTQDAFMLIEFLELEKTPPQKINFTTPDYEMGKYGYQALFHHPLFNDLHSAVTVFSPVKNKSIRLYGYFDADTKLNGKTLAVNKQYIFLKESERIALEYNQGKGKVIALGAYIDFSEKNAELIHLEKFISNAFTYLTSDSDGKYYWNYHPNEVLTFQSDFEKRSIKPAKKWDTSLDLPVLSRKKATSYFYDVTGRSMAAMGKEHAGIQEIWAHPVMAIKDYQVAIKIAGKIYPFSEFSPHIEVRPASLIRNYNIHGTTVKEVITVDAEKQISVMHYEINSNEPTKLFISFGNFLRVMWPYSENVLGNTLYTYDKNIDAVFIKNELEDYAVILGGNKKIESCDFGTQKSTVFDSSGFYFTDNNEMNVSTVLSFRCDKSDNLDIVLSVSNENPEKTVSDFLSAVADPVAVYDKRVAMQNTFADETITIETPDALLNEGFKWAKIGTDRFFVHTPGMGTSLMAGYSTTKRGWNGGHTISGRPGYAWYFGRDAVWSAFAMLGYGDFEKVKQVIEFLQKYQNLKGKVFHEATTSGTVHYDASDATPLYIILAGEYYKYTGDKDFIRNSWNHINKAIDFCFSTDTDKDHLIENTNVGHGWVEGGKLYGSHSSLYLTACWARALENASEMATALGFDSLTTFWQSEAEIVRQKINADFWNQEKNFHYFGLLPDGSYKDDVTILATVPLILNQTDANKAKIVLDKLSGSNFTTDWGACIVSNENVFDNWAGYAGGAVWPLFTGWLSSAQYDNGYELPAYANVMGSLAMYQDWTLGFIEEVLKGEVYQMSGVTSHQCWSEAMALNSVISGMMGIKPNLREGYVEIFPKVPAHWNTFALQNIPAFNGTFDMTMRRNNDGITYFFKNNTNQKIPIAFSPILYSGMENIKCELNGLIISPNEISPSDLSPLNITFNLSETYTITLKYDKAIQISPFFKKPEVGKPSKNMKIKQAFLEEGVYTIQVEGTSESTDTLMCYVKGYDVESINNSTILNDDSEIMKLLVKFDDVPKGEWIKKQIKIKVK